MSTRSPRFYKNYLICVFVAVVVVCGLSFSARAISAEVRLYGLGGLGYFNKKVTTVRESRFKNLIEQKYDFSCGAAAVTTILKYAYHINVTELDIIEGMLKVSDPDVVKEKGFSLLDIRRYVESHGLRGRGYNLKVEALGTIRIPTITLLDIKGYQHFVVLKRTIGNDVYVADPALGNRVINRDEFLASWNGVVFAIVGKGFDKNTILSHPDAPLTARKFLDGFAPITDSELLDFGFSHADLF